MALYQEIMRVPGLSGTWQQRNAQLYKMLGSPMGPYKGTYDQNMYLLNQLHNNNYYSSGLPGQTSSATTSAAATTTPQEQILKGATENLKPNTDIYSQDVMTQEAWFRPFDEWTRNYVDTYMRPEWEQDVYNPAMKEMTGKLNETNQSMGTSGAWRTGTARKNLADMAKEMTSEEARMRKAFQDQTVAIRDKIRSSLAVPLYSSNMQRWGDSPWGDLNLEGVDVGSAATGTGITGDPLNELIQQLPNWTPNKDAELPALDWTVKPDSPYSPTLFGQYTTGRY